MNVDLNICLLCTGSACSKKKDALKRLRKALATDAHLVPVKCQKICKGPVIGVRLNGRLEWFSKMRRAKHYEALRITLASGKMTGSLVKAREKKRSGRLRS